MILKPERPIIKGDIPEKDPDRPGPKLNHAPCPA